MRRTHPIASWLLLSLLAGRAAIAVPVDAPPTDAPPNEKAVPAAKPGELAPLIARLGAADWQAREKAMRELIALGDAARPALRAALRSQDPEARWRATYALSLLDIALEPIQADAARTLYASAARARVQKDGQDAARQLYAEVIQRFPDSRWAAAARERLAALRADKGRKEREPLGPEAIYQLIARLGGTSWSERQEASHRLAELGEAARPALEAAAQGTDPEAAWRARHLLARLDAARPTEKPKAAGHGLKLMAEVFGPAARAKAEPAGPNDLDGFVRSLSSDDAGEVARAREVLLNVGRDALAPLIHGLETCDETAGVEIMDLLRQITKQDLGFDPDLWQAWWRDRQERGRD